MQQTPPGNTQHYEPFKMEDKMIPEQLKNEEFRLIKINPNNRKVPLETDWTNAANYAPDNPIIQEWVYNGNNYGVATGFGDLIVIDSDNQQLQNIVEENLPETFKVRTGGGGYHNYFICKDQPKIIFENGGNTHLGELQSKGQQVIGPGSIHPNGKPYEVVNELSIVTITPEDIKKLPSDIFKQQQTFTETKSNYQSTSNNLSITDVVPMNGLIKKGNGEYQGKHPIHGSDTGSNFTVKPNSNVWHCFRHNCGGDPILWIAIQEGIINCGDTLDKIKYKKTFDIAHNKYNFKRDVEIVEKPPAPDHAKLRGDVLSLLSEKPPRRAEATELLVQEIETGQHFYTIRDDDRLEIWTYSDGIYIPNGVTVIKEKCRQILGQHNTSQLVNQIVFKIETDTYVDQNEFFNHNIKDEIVVENGILNLLTKELTPYDPEKIFFSKIPVIYDPEARCPHIEEFLSQVVKNQSDVPIFQELMGYLLWKEYNIEKAFMFIGTGRNGKGKTIQLMRKFLGDDNYTSVTLQSMENDNFSLGELHKKLANLCGDIDERALKYTGSFKNLTGRDTISADRKFKTRVHFENFAKLVFAANQLPRTGDLSEGFFMRWVLLEFPYTFVTQETYDLVLDVKQKQWLKIRDPDILDKIATPEELSGMLNYGLDGLDRLFANKDFSYSKSVTDVRNMWMRKSDSFTAFCMDCVEENYGVEVRKSDIRHEYNNYCKKFKLKPVNDKIIKNTLSLMFGCYENKILIDSNRVHMWSGISIKEKVVEYSSLQMD